MNCQQKAIVTIFILVRRKFVEEGKGKDAFPAKLTSSLKIHRHLCSVHNNIKQTNKARECRDSTTRN